MDFDDYGDIHIPAAILKTFLRELPQPLLTFEAYEQILGITSMSLPPGRSRGRAGPGRPPPAVFIWHCRPGEGAAPTWTPARLSQATTVVPEKHSVSEAKLSLWPFCTREWGCRGADRVF